ncbi:hypothetical protein [Mesorhizobium sp. KR9-304]|uniref:hypothetical protein n=1 Tax=Mesorhizobium sp. KR9-304 TaxID=3156614 RepID=UPI0032B59DEE
MAKGQVAADRMTVGSALGALDEMESDLRHLIGLIAAFRILGEADDSIEPVAVSSLARCAHETLEELERNWRTAIGALRER